MGIENCCGIGSGKNPSNNNNFRACQKCICQMKGTTYSDSSTQLSDFLMHQNRHRQVAKVVKSCSAAPSISPVQFHEIACDPAGAHVPHCCFLNTH